MAALDSGEATPSKLSKSWPSLGVGTARAASGTAVCDCAALLLLLFQSVGMARACSGPTVPRFQAAICYVF